ncbi:MAG: hypothetical protein VW268_15385 [Rhodospirillaceae bacterium]
MAIDITPGIAVQLDRAGQEAAFLLQQTAAPSATRATTPSRNLPDEFGLSLSQRNGINLPVASAERAVARSIADGTQIVDTLRKLEQQLTDAVNSGLVSERTELRIDETRVSRLNVTVSADRALTAIDRLVSQAETNGVNLISGNQGRITIQTTEFGGRISVRAQPLDSDALGLAGISALTAGKALEARDRVRIAIATAVRRLDNLAALRDSLGFRYGDPFTVVNFGNETVFEDTVRGRLVDVSA